MIKNFNNQDWNLLLRQASSAKILTRIADSIDEANITYLVPEKILNHINSEQVKVAHLHTQVSQEVQELNQLFNKLNIKAIYLKGAAYLLAGLPVANGRTFSDIDILLEQDDIAKVEIALKCQGWKSQKTDDHDQAYYRDYMHEIPPMQNILRGTVIDIHHNILPVCNDNKIEISLLSTGALQVNELSNVNTNSHVLAPAAMFLHSAIHLFHEGELEQGLRGLSDLDILLCHFEAQETDFSQQLIDLSASINQQQSLFYAWRYLQLILQRGLSETAQKFIDNYQGQIRHLTNADFIFTQLLDVHHSTTTSWKFSIACQLAYWRGHLLRMPLKLLIPHLVKKSWLKLIEFKKDDLTMPHKVDAKDPRFQPQEED